MNRTIKVTGRGRVSLKPDTIRLNFSMESVEEDYEAAVRVSADHKKELTDALETAGFKREDLKTTNFGVSPDYEGYTTKSGEWKRRFKGYRYHHNMKLEFPADNKRLGQVLTLVSNIQSHPEFTMEYTVADREAAKNQLLANAVADSKEKARVLSSAAGVELGEIISIDYSWGEIDFVSRPIDIMMLRCEEDSQTMGKGCIEPDIEADDIDVTDTVTLLYEIR